MVLDTFAGSATTAMAAHFTGRHFQGCEVDEEMWEKSITRIQGEIQWQRKQTEQKMQAERKRQASATASSQKLNTQDPTAGIKITKSRTEDKENDTTIPYGA